MNYEASDSSGTDDDLPPSHHNRIPRGGRVSAKGMPALSSFPYPRVQNDMEAQIHHLEQEAYCAVLRAFKAQADAITWDKESLITELRKELRVSDDEHRELLTRVNSDDIIREIREWRQAGGHQNVRRSSSQPVHDVVPSPTVSASRKKQKTSQLSTPLPSFSRKPMQYSSSVPAGSRQLNNHSSSGALLANEPAAAATHDNLIGRKVWTRWPEDNSFYEAVIKDYDPVKGQHGLVYDMNTANETWEWVDIKEIPPEDIRWDGEDPGTIYRGHGGQSRVYRKSQSFRGYVPGAGRGRGHSRGQSRKELSPSQNGVAKKVVDDIELLNTEALVKEVEKVFSASNPDPLELEKAKKMLKDHEQALVEAISRLTYASDGESEGAQPNLQDQLADANNDA